MRFLRWMITVIVLIVVIGGAYVVRLIVWPTLPTTDIHDIASVDVHLEEWKDNTGKLIYPEIRLTIHDSTKIQPLLAVFAKSRSTSEHKCGPIGTITLHTRRGAVERLEILPGHDAEFYEYRFHGIKRVNREQFLRAVQELGIEQLALD